MRYLAIDYGLKRTGLAVCDPAEKICSPHSVIEGQKGLTDKLVQLIQGERIEAVVIGLPLNMDDSKGPQAEAAEAFGSQLQKRIDIPIHFFDERLSSFAAEEKLAAAGLNSSEKKKRLDAIAAAQILQAFLDAKRP